jgi:YVTN family beta-propeller protein
MSLQSLLTIILRPAGWSGLPSCSAMLLENAMNSLPRFVGAFVLCSACVGAFGSPEEGPGGTLIVLNKSDATASLIDRRTGEEVATLPTGIGPHEVAVSPDGRLAVVGNYGQREPGHTLTAIDVPGRRVTGTIDLRDYHRPHGMVFMPDGKRLVVTAEVEQKLLVVDVAAGEVVHAIDTGQDISHMVALAPQADRAFVANIRSGSVSVIDLSAAERTAIIETGPGAEGIEITPDGREVWVTNRAADTVSIIDAQSLRVVQTLPCASFPIRIKFTPDGRFALVSNARSADVAVFDVRARQEVRRVAMQATAVERKDERLFRDTFGESPVPIGILIPPDGRQAYVANTNADIVTVIDLQSWQIAGRLKAGREPDGLGYSAAQ